MIGFGMHEFETLLAVLNEMFAAEDRRPIIIFQGGGNEILRIKTGDDSLWRFYTSRMRPAGVRTYMKRYLEFSNITDTVERSRTTIFSVIPGIRVLGLSKKEQLERATISIENLVIQFEDFTGQMRDGSRHAKLVREFRDAELKRLIASQTATLKIAELSGGFISFLETPQDAEDIYSNILANIKNRYVIGYYPTNQEQDGKRREVKIEVRGHPEYIVTGRKSYYLHPEKSTTY